MFKVIYIILNYKSYKDTIRLVEELLPSIKEDRKIVVVDNFSPNESYKELCNAFEGKQEVDIIQSTENGGFAKGNNFGLRYVKKYSPKYVCIINNDVHFDGGLVDRLAEVYEYLPNAGIIAPKQINPDGSLTKFGYLGYQSFWADIRAYSILFRNPKHKYKENTPYKDVQAINIIPGAFMFARYDLLERINFFYEKTFLYCEERFISEKIEKAGYQNYIVLNETYIHEHSKTISNETTLKQQDKFLFEGRLLFAKEVRKDNWLKLCLLKFMYKLHRIEIQYIISPIIKPLKKNGK